MTSQPKRLKFLILKLAYAQNGRKLQILEQKLIDRDTSNVGCDCKVQKDSILE